MDDESRRADCAMSILEELKRTSAEHDAVGHSSAFDRISEEYQPLIGGKRISFPVFAELIALNGAIDAELLGGAQRARLVEVDSVVVLGPLKEHFKEHVLLEVESVHYKEEYENASARLGAVENSKSFRFGAAVTAIPRRIKRFVS